MKLNEHIKSKREKLNKSLQSISDSSKILFPNEKERQVSASYLSRVEDGLISDINPKKIHTIAQILDENFYYLLYLAGYIDDNPKEIEISNEYLLQKSIDVNKLLSDQNIKVHFCGSPIDEEKKQAILMVLRNMIK